VKARISCKTTRAQRTEIFIAIFTLSGSLKKLLRHLSYSS